MITPPFCIIFHAEADFKAKAGPNPLKTKEKRACGHKKSKIIFHNFTSHQNIAYNLIILEPPGGFSGSGGLAGEI